MNRLHLILSLMLLMPFQGHAGQPEVAQPEHAADQQLQQHTDGAAGYSMRIPEGYKVLTSEESREVFKGISEHFGKQIGERAQRTSPAWFKGPINPAKPKALPPSLAIGQTELSEPIDPSRMAQYKTELEEAYRKRGEKHGDISVSIVKVDGMDSLRIEHEVYSPIDNSRSRIINFAVPGHGRRYDIVFNFSPDQEAGLKEAAATVLRTFHVDEHPIADADTKTKWSRVLLWTVGGFFAGVLFSVLLKYLAGVGRAKPV